MPHHIDIINPEKCCGCRACYSICPVSCISMQCDKKGFEYPKVDESICIQCGKCKKVCPFINIFKPLKPIKCYATVNENMEERIKSSSGGIFIAMAKNIIKNDGIVVGAVFDENLNVVHKCASTIEEVYPMMGSKYLQSSIQNVLKEVRTFLKLGKKVLFTGTQCQIAGLNHFLETNYPNLITIEVICHGVPSPSVWNSYLLSLNLKEDRSKVKCYFRDKESGWKSFSLKILSDKIHFNESHKVNLYMRAFLSNYSLRPSCYNCKSKGGRSNADITIGDFWGIKEFYNNKEDDRGISAVIIQSDKGNLFYTNIEGLLMEEVEYSEILSGNLSLESSVRAPKLINKFWDLYFSKGLNIAIKKVSTRPLYKRIGSKLKNILKLYF